MYLWKGLGPVEDTTSTLHTTCRHPRKRGVGEEERFQGTKSLTGIRLSRDAVPSNGRLVTSLALPYRSNCRIHPTARITCLLMAKPPMCEREMGREGDPERERERERSASADSPKPDSNRRFWLYRTRTSSTLPSKCQSLNRAARRTNSSRVNPRIKAPPHPQIPTPPPPPTVAHT